jgi:hypothetical protein
MGVSRRRCDGGVAKVGFRGSAEWICVSVVAMTPIGPRAGIFHVFGGGVAAEELRELGLER